MLSEVALREQQDAAGRRLRGGGAGEDDVERLDSGLIYACPKSLELVFTRHEFGPLDLYEGNVAATVQFARYGNPALTAHVGDFCATKLWRICDEVFSARQNMSDRHRHTAIASHAKDFVAKFFGEDQAKLSWQIANFEDMETLRRIAPGFAWHHERDAEEEERQERQDIANLGNESD